MYSIEIKNIIFTVGIENNSLIYYILSSNPEGVTIPSILLSNKHSLEQSRKICFENYISLKADWVENKLLDIQQDNNNIIIYYVYTIPIETKVINGKFIPLSKALFDPIINKASRYI